MNSQPTKNAACGRRSAAWRFELSFFIGPCTVEEAEALADTLLDLSEAKAVGIGAIGAHAVDESGSPVPWPGVFDADA